MMILTKSLWYNVDLIDGLHMQNLSSNNPD